jgi:hypothetical protein
MGTTMPVHAEEGPTFSDQPSTHEDRHSAKLQKGRKCGPGYTLNVTEPE